MHGSSILNILIRLCWGPIRLYENKPLIKEQLPGHSHFAVFHLHRVTIFFSCCSMLLFACEEQSWVGSRCRFLSRVTWHESRSRYVHPPHLPDNRLPHRTAVLVVTSVEFPQGQDHHFGALGHSQREELLLSPLHLSMGCSKFNPDENAVRPFSLQQWLCHCNRSHS